MRDHRRKLLNIAGAFFLLTLLLRIVFLITGLRSYAVRPEIPFRILEMAAVLLAALFTYFISYRYGWMLLSGFSLLALTTPIREMASELGGSAGSLNWERHADKYIFDIILIVGLLMLFMLGVFINPKLPRRKLAHPIRVLSMLVILVSAAELVYTVVSLFMTLAAETYPGEFTTKYHYTLMTTFFALVLTGVACLITPNIHIHRSDRSKDSEHRSDHHSERRTKHRERDFV